MQTSLVLTVIGDDKPGIVERISDRALATGANWEESSMARLGGKFAGLLRLSVASEKAEALAADLRNLSAAGLSVVVEVTRVPDLEPARHLHLNVIGNDRPGIVRDLSRVLAEHQANIESLDTCVINAPMSGDPLFTADATLRVPATTTVEELRTVLEALAGELMVDLTFEDASN